MWIQLTCLLTIWTEIKVWKCLSFKSPSRADPMHSAPLNGFIELKEQSWTPYPYPQDPQGYWNPATTWWEYFLLGRNLVSDSSPLLILLCYIAVLLLWFSWEKVNWYEAYSVWREAAREIFINFGFYQFMALVHFVRLI